MGLYISGIVWYVLFIFWLFKILVSVFTLRSIHILVYIPTSSASVLPFLHILTNASYHVFLTTVEIITKHNYFHVMLTMFVTIFFPFCDLMDYKQLRNEHYLIFLS